MFKKAPTKEDEKFSIIQDKLLTEMTTYSPDEPEFSEALKQLEKIDKLQTTTRPLKGLDPNTIALVLGNLFGILVIVAYEQKHVMVSKGMNFLLKAK